jgi:peroxiredoxin
MSKITAIISTVALLLAGISSLTGCSSTSNAAGISSHPDFALKNLQGDTVSLSDLRGKVVLINFWAVSCPPCVEEMPTFQSLYRDWAARTDVVFLAINTGESAGTVNDFMQANKYTFTALLDSQYKATEDFQIQYTPTTVLIDKDGNLKYRVVGPFKDKATILKAIGKYLP